MDKKRKAEFGKLLSARAQVEGSRAGGLPCLISQGEGKSTIMSVKSILGAFEFRTKVSRVSGWRRTPLAAALVLAVVQDRFLAPGTISGYFVLEKFNPMPAIGASDLENGIKTPALGIISGAFSHWYIYIIYCLCQVK
jgi:hypothetical protein